MSGMSDALAGPEVAEHRRLERVIATRLKRVRVAWEDIMEHVSHEPNCHFGAQADENGSAYEDCSNGCTVGQKWDAMVAALELLR